MTNVNINRETRYVVAGLPGGTQKEFKSEKDAIAFAVTALIQDRIKDDPPINEIGQAVADLADELVPLLTRLTHPKFDLEDRTA